MKRLLPSGLITFLQQNPNCLKADLFIITLPTGTVLYATDGQFDITLTTFVASPQSGTPGWAGATTTFKATQYGRWKRGSITSEASFNCNSNAMSLTCVPQPGTSYPGLSVGILNAAYSGLFDGAQVDVLTAYMPLLNYGNVSHGVETKFTGTITKITNINRTMVEFECADPFYLLDMKVPTRLIQSNCPWGFCDSNCTLSVATYTQNFTALAGSTSWQLYPVTPFAQASGYFTQGVVKCLTGANAGLSQLVKLNSTVGQFTLSAAANASGGNTVYTGTVTGGASNAYAGRYFVVAGFVSHTSNNGTFLCVASDATHLTLVNSAGVSESHASTANDTGYLTVSSQWLLPITAGDTFSVIAGCDKTLTACKSRKTAVGGSVDNSINFGGMPFVPVPAKAL